VETECSRTGVNAPDPGQTNDYVMKTLENNRGTMFVSVECQKGTNGCESGTGAPRTRGINALFGDATIIDFGQGYAYSVNAIHIQNGRGQNNGDRQYMFDGNEYAAFPAALAANYVSPTFDGISANLILFTLDGTTNDDNPIEFKLSGDVYDDDENPLSGGDKFDCFVNAPLEDVFSTNVFREFSGSPVGHLELLVSQVSNQIDTNEQSPVTGDASGNRRRPVHGWIVQHIANGANGVDPEWPAVPGFTGSGAFARTLTQGTLAMAPTAGDYPALSAGN
jgi:hypothetical protein